MRIQLFRSVLLENEACVSCCFGAAFIFFSVLGCTRSAVECIVRTVHRFGKEQISHTGDIECVRV